MAGRDVSSPAEGVPQYSRDQIGHHVGRWSVTAALVERKCAFVSSRHEWERAAALFYSSNAPSIEGAHNWLECIQAGDLLFRIGEAEDAALAGFLQVGDVTAAPVLVSAFLTQRDRSQEQIDL